MSNQIDLGVVLSVPKGDWNATTTYERLNLVRHNSASWICNVATSTGVEPKEGVADWYLQVKDTSAVSSVNNKTGDVIIDSLEESPSLADNSTKIATTAWVNNKLNDSSDSLKTYTDDAVAQAETDIKNDVDERVATKIETAVSAFNNKFNDYIPTTGGSVTGTLSFSVNTDSGLNCITANANDGYLQFLGSNAWANGAVLTLNGKSRPSKTGWAELRAADGTNAAAFLLKPDGTATLGGQNIARSVNGQNAGTDGAVKLWAINKGNVSVNTLTEPGAYYLSGANTALPNGTNGYITVETVNANAYIRQIFYRTGTVNSDDHNIYTRIRDTSSGGSDWGSWVKILTSKDTVTTAASVSNVAMATSSTFQGCTKVTSGSAIYAKLPTGGTWRYYRTGASTSVAEVAGGSQIQVYSPGSGSGDGAAGPYYYSFIAVRYK